MMSKQRIEAKILLGMPLTEAEKAFAVLYMNYSLKEVNYEKQSQ